MKKLKTVYFGTPEFSVPTLEMLSKHPNIELTYVVSMPDRPAGRGKQLKSPEVIEFCKNNNIPYKQTENINKEEEFLKEIENNDIFIVLAFAQFLGTKILEMPKIGCFNIHTSILPKYRGAAPIQYAILNGDTETGVSIQKMVKKMDAGDLVYFKEVAIGSHETGGELYNKLKDLAATSMSKFIEIILKDEITYIPQDESKVSFAPTLKKDDGKIDFKNKTSHEIFNQVRALFPWPGTSCLINGKKIKVLSVEESDSKLKPLEIKIENGINIGCKEGSIKLLEIQTPGKKACHSKDFLNGIRGEITIG